jgi:putative membrane protein
MFSDTAQPPRSAPKTRHPIGAKALSDRGCEGNDSETTNAPLMSGAPQEEAADALRRTRLANEWTYLAWWRTGLTSLAVGLGAGKLVPKLSGGAAWPFELVGTAFAVTGIAFIAYAYIRQKQVEDAVARGSYAAFNPSASLSFAAVRILLGLGTTIVILAGTR